MAKKKQQRISAKDMVSTGSTLLNLACAGRVGGGFIKGLYYFLVGDSTSGKTFLALTCFAEACRNENFKDYRLIYDNAEDGALMDISKFFGEKVYDRMEPPALDENEAPVFSSTIEEFYYHIDDAIASGRPFIYVLDSMDSLSSEAEADKFQEQKEAYEKGKEDTAGSYGDGKAKKNAANLRRLIPHLRDTGSILIIINQTRDNLAKGSFEKKTRSGGHALSFYATLELWSSVKSKITKTIKGKQRQLGAICKVKVKKNRITGKERVIEIPFYHSFGIDDIGGCINYLFEEQHWRKSGQTLNAPEFDFKGTVPGFIKHVEENGYEKDLRSLVGEVWNDIEEATQIQRKRRYD